MNLLVISNNPGRASFRQRIEIHLAVLRQNGIECEVARLPAGSWARRRLFPRARGFDGVLFHKKGLNVLDAFWLRKHSRTLIYDFDDAVMYSPKTPDRDSLSRLRRFRRSVQAAGLVIAGNAYLAEQARKYNQKVEVIPTGLDIAAYKVDGGREPDGKVRLVWIGSKATLRYLAHIEEALEQVGSRFEHVVLRIICDAFLELRSLPVEKRHWSRQTQALDLASSDIALAPLSDDRYSRGKCGFKVLQYGAAGLPVVASPVGVNAEYVVDGVTGFHASNISQWVDRISKLIESRQLRQEMGQAARKQVSRFDVGEIGNQLITTLKNHLLGR
jgi:glycosyltransferase involved in cell wall biosynthesis